MAKLAPGRYVATVTAPWDAAFTAWRDANRTAVKIVETRSSPGYDLEDPKSVATYSLVVGREVVVPDELRAGFARLTSVNTDPLYPTSDPSYDPEPEGLGTTIARGVFLLATAAIVAWALGRGRSGPS